MKIDLHLHTYYSDGTLSPYDLVKRAKDFGVETVAITDHDGMGGISEGLRAGEDLGVRVIPGVEFSAALAERDIFRRKASQGEDIYMHILGYGMNPEDKELKGILSEIMANRVRRNDKMLKTLGELGYKIQEEDLKAYPQQTYIGKPNMARALMKRGYVNSVAEAFRRGKFLGHPEIKAIHRVKVDAQEVMKIIRNAGGKVVLAHPMKITYKDKNLEGCYFEKLEVLIAAMKNLGLDGLECYYNFSQLITETEELLLLAKKYDLLISAGTDFHGPGMNPEIEVGKFPISPSQSNLQYSICP